MAAALAAAALLTSSTAAAQLAPAVGPSGAEGFFGYPLWYRDAAGVQVVPCLDPSTNCLPPEGIDVGQPLALDGNFPEEFFYWTADAEVAGVLLILALEGAFANDVVADGDQAVFTRIRFDAPPGTLMPDHPYTITHPYGTKVVTAEADGSLPGSKNTEDYGLAALAFPAAWSGPIQQLLIPVEGAPAGHLGNAATPRRVTGSPTGNNFFRIEGHGIGNSGCVPARDGCVQTDLFVVSGRLYTGGGPAEKLRVSGLADGTAGVQQNAVVAAQDAVDDLDSNYSGTVQLSLATDDPGALLPAAAPLVSGSGVGTFAVTPTRAGTWTLVATDTVTATITGSQTITISPAAPATVAAQVGGGQSGSVGTTLAEPLVVKVTDAFGNAVPGVPVTFTTDTGASFTPSATVDTLADGTASVTVTLPTLPGTHSFSASVSGTTPAAFSAEAVAGAANKIELQGLPATVDAGQKADFLLAVLDSLGNVAAGFNGAVELTSDDPEAVFSPSTSVQFTNGAAAGPVTVTFKKGGTRTVFATAAGLVPATAQVQVEADDESGSGCSTGGGGGELALLALLLAPVMRLRRRFARVTVVAVALLAAAPSLAQIAPGPVGRLGYPSYYQFDTVFLDPCLDPADANCLAPLGIPTPASRLAVPDNFPEEFFYYSAEATAGPIKWFIVLEGAFGTGAPAAGQQMVFRRIQVDADPSSFPANSTCTIDTPYGQLDVPVDADGGISAFRDELVPGPLDFAGALGDPLTVLLHGTTAAPGHIGTLAGSTATIGPGGPPASLSICTGETTTTFSISGRLANVVDGIHLGNGPAKWLEVTGLADGVAGVEQTATVSALDPHLNTLASYAGTVHLSVAGPNPGALAADSTLTLGSGTFAVTPTRAGTWTLVATDTVTGSVTGSQTVTISAAASVSLAVQGGDGQLGIAGTTLAEPLAVRVSDAFGNGVPGVEVTFATTSGATFIGSPVVTTGADGIASIGVTLSPTVGENAFTAEAPGLGTVNLTAQAQAGSGSTIQQAGLAASVEEGQATSFTLSVHDANGNLATGYTGVIALLSDDPGAQFSSATVAVVNGQAASPVSVTFRRVGQRHVLATGADLVPADFSIEVLAEPDEGGCSTAGGGMDLALLLGGAFAAARRLRRR
jgi:hypothetical protein